MGWIRELPAVCYALAGGVGLLLVNRWLKGSNRTLRITVPATTANLACGFDAFGAAFEMRMIVLARLAPPSQTETRFEYEGEGAAEVARGETNLLWQSALACIKMHAPGRIMPKLNISVQNPVPFGRGLGSSATAIIAGVVLANEFLSLSLTHEQLLNAALQLENHPDNLAAALWGGAVASGVSEKGRSMVKPFAINPALKAVVLVPDFQLATEKARGVLPKEYVRADVVFNLQRAALLPLALSAPTLDPEMVRECMKDKIHQNQRAPLIPGLRAVLDLPHLGTPPLPTPPTPTTPAAASSSSGSPSAAAAAWPAGAPPPEGLVATALSGAGPSMLALATGNLEGIGGAMRDILAAHGVRSKYYALPFAGVGTTINWL